MSRPAIPEGVQRLELAEIETAGPPLLEVAVQFTPELIKALPPKRAYVLHDSRTGRPVLVKGKVAILAGKGGAGKTMALLQAAVAWATGRNWFGDEGWETRSPHRVALLLGEEDRDEVLRRLHHICHALGLTDAEIELVAKNVTVLPLAGRGVALTFKATVTSAGLPETERAEEIRALLRAAVAESRPFDLVIVDPLSRFAGPDVELENPAATRFVQVLETFTADDCGAPTIIVAHHLRKAGADDDREASEQIRGAVGLVDGTRFVALLAQQKPIDGAPDLLRLRVVKSNYAAIPEPLTLCRPNDGEGTLRTATAQELTDYEGRRSKGSGSRNGNGDGEDLSGLILAELAKRPGSGSDVARRIKRRKAEVFQTLTDLEGDGFIRSENRQWCLTEIGSRVPGTVPVPGTDAQSEAVPEFPPFKGEPEPEPILGTEGVE
jgi:hypothetical protein